MRGKLTNCNAAAKVTVFAPLHPAIAGAARQRRARCTGEVRPPTTASTCRHSRERVLTRKGNGHHCISPAASIAQRAAPATATRTLADRRRDRSTRGARAAAPPAPTADHRRPRRHTGRHCATATPTSPGAALLAFHVSSAPSATGTPERNRIFVHHLFRCLRAWLVNREAKIKFAERAEGRFSWEAAASLFALAESAFSGRPLRSFRGV